MNEMVTAVDGRRLRGERSRRMVLRHAVDMASVDGLSGLSYGELATGLGLSKSGVQTLFPSKETLQLAVIDCAGEVFAEAVVRPTHGMPNGVPRLSALIERWIEYAAGPLLPGGCFWAANLADLDGRPGPVRDALFAQQRAWRGLLAAQVRAAIAAGAIAPADADLTAFQLDAVLIAVNHALRLGDPAAVDRLRSIVAGILAPPR
jgi:AcrR family transcriptional regulator